VEGDDGHDRLQGDRRRLREAGWPRAVGLDFVGSYHLKLHGEVDALVFTGGIGEKSSLLREHVGKPVECLGFARIDTHANSRGVEQAQGNVVDLGMPGREKRVLVCKTDEQVGRGACYVLQSRR
jgi:hypothetical protein